jgi:hypothetical protein
MTFTPYGVYNVCATIQSLRDFIEVNRRYFAEVAYDKASARECDAMLCASAKFVQSAKPGEDSSQPEGGT